MKCQTWLCYTCLVFIDFYMFLVLCKLIHSREVASLGKIAFFKTTWFSKGNMAVHATWRASGSLCWRLCWMSLGSCAERLLAHCEETGSTEIHLVVLFGFSGIHILFPGDAGPHRHPCSRFVAENVARILQNISPLFRF